MQGNKILSDYKPDKINPKFLDLYNYIMVNGNAEALLKYSQSTLSIVIEALSILCNYFEDVKDKYGEQSGGMINNIASLVNFLQEHKLETIKYDTSQLNHEHETKFTFAGQDYIDKYKDKYACQSDGRDIRKDGIENYLTNREAQCLEYLIAGHSAKQIAKLLNISYRTVEAYASTIRRKLHCKNTKQLIYYMYKAIYNK